jgi:hypothetical protein
MKERELEKANGASSSSEMDDENAPKGDDTPQASPHPNEDK